MGGSGGAALSAVVALVAVIARLVWALDRAERRRAVRARRLGQPPPTPVMPYRVTAPTRPAAAPSATRTAAVPQDEPKIEVPQRLFVAAARTVTSSLYASDTMLQRKLRIDTETTSRLMLALEGAGIIGPAKLGRHEVLVTVSGLPEVFARHGIVEDAVPPGFE